mgnify:CR=1 FL=1
MAVPYFFMFFMAVSKKVFVIFSEVARLCATLPPFRTTGERVIAMEGKERNRPLSKRIRSGEIRKSDVIRRLGELAFGTVNDCVRLVLEDSPALDGLDLSLLCEVKRNEKGTVEVKVLDRLKVLEQLAGMIDEENAGMEGFLLALQGGEKE